MTILLADRVQETTTTTGTGTISLGGAAPFFQTFATGIGTGNSTYYCIFSGADWETGIGAVGGSGPYTLSRSVIASSNSNSAISLTGTSTVFCNIPAFGVQTHALTVAATIAGSGSIPANTEYFIGFNTVVIDTDNIAGSAVNLLAPFTSSTIQGITVPAAWNNHIAVISGNIQVTSNTGSGIALVGVYRSGTCVMVSQLCSSGGFSNPGRNANSVPVAIQTNDIIFLSFEANAAVTLTSSAGFTFSSTANTWLGVCLIG